MNSQTPLPATERAVSPVIGVILMVAITVILAAVMAAFVLDIGQDTSVNPSAGVSFSEGSDENVTVQFISDDRTEGSVFVHCGGVDGDLTDPPDGDDGATLGIGSTHTCASPNEITVGAEYRGEAGVVATWTA